MTDIGTTKTLTPTSALEATYQPRPAERFEALAVVDQLLRDRPALLARIDAGHELPMIARTMLLTIITSALVFGASLGVLRGGEQILYAALKLPIVILLTAAITTPALCALRAVLLGRTNIQRDIAIVLSSLALGSMVLAALAPLILLATIWGMGYHGLIILVVACCAISGAVGLTLFARGTKDMGAGSRALVVGIVLIILALVGSQMAWTFRPYLVRPRSEEVPIMRALEGSFIDSVTTSSASALGIYSRASAPLPGERR